MFVKLNEILWIIIVIISLGRTKLYFNYDID